MGCGGRINQEFEINICTLLYIKQIIYKELLCSTGNYAQYFIVTQRKSEKEHTYIYNQLAVHLKLIQHCKSLYFNKKILSTCEQGYLKSTLEWQKIHNRCGRMHYLSCTEQFKYLKKAKQRYLPIFQGSVTFPT